MIDIDINELRSMVNATQFESFANSVINSLLDRLEAAEAEAIEEARLNGMGSEREAALMTKLEAAEKECAALRDKIKQMEQQEPVAKVRVHQTGGNAGIAWSVAPLNDFDALPLMRDGSKLYALPGAQPAPNFADAYQGAMEEVAIWKKRALEAEDLNRKFSAEINGPTYMGEPAHPKPDCGEAGHDEGRCGNRQCLPGARPSPSINPASLYAVINWLRNGCDPRKAADELEMFAATLEAKP